MKKFIFFCIFPFAISQAIAQNVQFSSSNIETGIRQHLDISETDNITIDQIDTITHLDLSGRFIHDIRDISLLSNIKYLDLSNNIIDDVSPLVTLESLRHLKLSHNNLESISMLSFSYAKEMYVDVAFNYIKDFSLFNTLTHCNFTLDGVGLQEEKNAPYFRVYQFYSNVGTDNKLTVSYRGYTNMEADATLQYVSKTIPVTLDGNYQTVEILDVPNTPTKILLTNGEQSETTYIVPVANFTVEGGETVFLETDLPEDYRLSFAYAKKGSLEIEGNTMKYTAPKTALPDIVYFWYHQGATLKGFSHYYLNNNKQIGDVTNDGNVNATDVTALVNYILGRGTLANEAAAYVNDDTKIDIQDVAALIELIKKM